MDVITSTITGGAFGVIIYFFICNGEEKTVNLHAIVFLCSTCSNGSLFLMYQYSYVIAFFTNMESP